MTKQIIISLKKAVWDNKDVTISGAVFSPDEVQELITEREKLFEALQSMVNKFPRPTVKSFDKLVAYENAQKFLNKGQKT